MKKIFILFTLLGVSAAFAQTSKTFHVKSPDGKIDMTLDAGAKLSWSVKHEDTQVIAPSDISMTLGNGIFLGKNAITTSAKASQITRPSIHRFTKRKRWRISTTSLL